MQLKKYFSFLLVFMVSVAVFAQDLNTIKPPKLVVGLVVDQMRWDFLNRYQPLYGKGGFRRLMTEGFRCENTFIPYVPTYTAAGHAAIFTGSVPAINGIVGNNWFDQATGLSIYCADDSTVHGVGSLTSAGNMSPRNMITTTIGDELKLSNNFQSKVIGISLKDRGAIFPAGHSANAAYWLDDEAGGKWITSSYYTDSLPGWVIDFNSRNLPDNYMKKDWNTLLPLSSYTQSTYDEQNYEGTIPGEKSTSFPHRLSEIKDKRMLAFRFTPFANTFSLDFAREAIEAEKLGQDAITDILTVSLSSTDYCGHEFGPNSIEVEDMYLRLDQDIASFLSYLDVKLGKGNYVFFITADHGVANIPAFLESKKIPAGTFRGKDLLTELNASVEKIWGYPKLIRKLENAQLYLDPSMMQKAGNEAGAIKAHLLQQLLDKPYVTNAFSLSALHEVTLPSAIKSTVANGYYPKRSGDIQIITLPNYIDKSKTGTTHGVWNPYDAHIPLIWFGTGIRKGALYRETYMTDIAATLAALLGIQMPNGCVGKVIEELMR